ncbi:ribonucleotide-diphosphate reductase subunit beta, partial [Acinetobacter baumannii]|nr:ribonucleotide-diphosphate reductase subunit beta [Acinetobacter baumannii]
MAISPMKHTWAKGILDRMENNTWFPHVVNMADDVASYNRLNAADRF